MSALSCLAEGDDDSVLRTSALLPAQHRNPTSLTPLPALGAAASLPDEVMASLVDACLVFLVDGDAPALVQHAEGGERTTNTLSALNHRASMRPPPVLSSLHFYSCYRRRARSINQQLAEGISHIFQGERPAAPSAQPRGPQDMCTHAFAGVLDSPGSCVSRAASNMFIQSESLIPPDCTLPLFITYAR